MNKFQSLIKAVNENKVKIITRTAIIGVGIVGVTLAAGLIKVGPEAVEATAKAVKKAAE